MKSVVASGTVLGTSALGVSAFTDDPTPAEDEQDGQQHVDPDAIKLEAVCVDTEGEFATFRIQNDSEQLVTLDHDGPPLYGEDSEGEGESGDGGADGDGDTDADGEGGADDETGDGDPVEEINAIVERINSRLANVSPIEPIDELTPEEVQRVQNEILDRIVCEINTQSRQQICRDIANDVSTPSEARKEACRIESEWGDAAGDAVDGLNEAADAVEEIQAIAEDAGVSSASLRSSAGRGTAAQSDGADAVEQVNAEIEAVNEQLENVEDIEPVDEITENTADELQEVIFTKVVEEINTQSQEEVGMDIADPVSTPDEAREEAESIKPLAEQNERAMEAVEGLQNAADTVETIHEIVDGSGAGGDSPADDGAEDDSADEDTSDDGGASNDGAEDDSADEDAGAGDGGGEGSADESDGSADDDTDDESTDDNAGDDSSVDSDITEEEAIERINSEIIAEINDGLDNVDPVEEIDEITESTADELQEEIFTQVVEEINTQSQETAGIDLVDPVSTPAEARAEAESIEPMAEQNERVMEAVDALNNSADHVEEIQQLVAAATGSGGLMVEAGESTEFRTELESDGTATVVLYHNDEEVAEATADADEIAGC